jgi:aldehyde:ferredoxin oxidoreductase
MSNYGYKGQILRVNLSNETYQIEELPEQIIKEYIGGRGFIAKYCFDEIGAGTDPMGASNKLFFASGPLNDSKIPGSGRYAVGTLSPLTGGFFRSISGGAWGAYLKRAGFDMLIIEGKAEDWTYLYIHDKTIEFKDARHMIGMLTEDTEAAIQKDLNSTKVKSCVIGPAGEIGVTYACIQTERRSAGRGGCGCVMGSKKLKGIAVYGTEITEFYDQNFNKMMLEHVKTNSKGGYYDHFHEYGTTTGCDLTHSIGVLPVKNFSRGVFPEIDKLLYDGINGLNYKTKNSGCYACYMQCGSEFDVPDGPFRGKGYENPEYETMWAFGANCWNSDFAAILKANQICDDYGIDTISTGNCVGFLMECFEKGYISKEDINGIELVWGDGVAMVEMAKQIAEMTSEIGRICAKGGVREAAKHIGRDSADFAMHNRGLELAAYDPRGIQAHGLGYATSNIGGSHQYGYSVQEIFGFPEKVDRFSPKDKGRHTIWSQRYITIFDCAVTCGFPNAFTESKMHFGNFGQWLEMATGIQDAFNSEEKMNQIYDRIYNIERAFNHKMGMTISDDDLPKRVKTEALPDGPSAGHLWHKEELLEDYFQKRGWNAETGVPLRETLEALNLKYVADMLEEMGIS